MMRVLIDDEIFSTQFEGGVSRYFTRLVEGLPVEGVTPLLPFSLTCNHHLAASSAFSGWRWPRFPGSRRLLRALNRPRSTRALAEGRFDLWHASWYDERLRLAAAATGRPIVTTVHDMAPELRPHVDRRGHSHPNPHQGKLEMVAAADLVVTVSQATKNDLMRFSAKPAERVRVIPLGVGAELCWRPETGRPPGLPERFLLLVGQRGGYKNFMGVAAALSSLLSAHKDLHIVCIGGGPLATAERAPFEANGVAHRLHQRAAGDATLAGCYAHAAAFLFPSRHEGFGLPILEAFINRCPVVLTNRTCFPEIADEAAVYFDPDRPDDLVELLGRLLADAPARNLLVERGLKRARDFTWAKTVAAHAALYRELMP